MKPLFQAPCTGSKAVADCVEAGSSQGGSSIYELCPISLVEDLVLHPLNLRLEETPILTSLVAMKRNRYGGRYQRHLSWPITSSCTFMDSSL